jgi:hypothetical protein
MTRPAANQACRHTISHTTAGQLKFRQKVTPSVFKPFKKYKKSVSNSLVYRSLKVDKDGYVGFKVTFSGKGCRGNHDKSRISLIMIPEISLVRSYRPIAGAIARATKSEVYTCCYTLSGSHNEKLVESIINRVKQSKSKLRRVDIISQSSEILHLLKERLSEASDKSQDVADTSIETPDGESPLHVCTVENKQSVKQIFLIKIDGRQKKSNTISSIFRSVMTKLGSIFARSDADVASKVTRNEKLPLEVYERLYRVNEKLSFESPFHCDIIAKEILMVASTQ